MNEVMFVDTRRYWDDVLCAAVDVFGGKRPAMRKRIDELTSRMEKWPMDEQLLFYHREPLYVAAELTGTDVDDEITDKYLQRVANADNR